MSQGRVDEDIPVADDPEPQLKYCNLEADAPAILAGDAATCFAASDKVHALGCRSGCIHVLDFEGHQIQLLRDHATPVSGLAFDHSLEYLASCAEDNSIVVRNVYSPEDRAWKTQTSSAGQPSCIAVNPWVAERQTREVAVGTKAGQVILVAKGWLGNREHVLASGEGSVHSIVWCQSTIAWATDVGLHAFVHDASAHRHGMHLPRPPSAGTGDCSITCVGKDLLLLAWPHAVQVVRLISNHARPSVDGARPTTPMPAGLGLQLVASFLTKFRVHGVAPFGPDLAVLADPNAHRPVTQHESAQLKASASTAPPAGSSVAGAPVQPLQAATSMNGASPADEGRNGQIAAQDRPSEGPASAESSPAERSPNAEGSSSEHTAAAENNAQDAPSACGTADPPHTTNNGENAPSTSAAKGAEESRRSDGCEATKASSNAPAPSEPTRSSAQAADEAAVRLPAARDAGGESTAAAEPSKQPSATEGRSAGPQLKIMTFEGRELCSDSIQIGISCPDDAPLLRLVSWYPERYTAAAHTHPLISGAAQPPANSLLDKWWQDEDEPLYYVLTPRLIILGKPCDADDQAAWLVQRGKFAAAVDVVQSATYVRLETRKASISAYIADLMRRDKFEAAAKAAASLLGDDREAWERLVFEFGQRRKLPILAPVVPVNPPLLGQTAYFMVLTSFMSRASDHPQLLELLRRWPPSIIRVDDLVQRATQRLAALPEASQAPMLQVMALLYRLQNRHEQALNIYIHLEDPDVLAYVRKYHLFAGLPRYAPMLMNVDEADAVALLVENCESVPVADVCRAIQALQQAADASGRREEAAVWRRRLHLYLHGLFLKDRTAAQDFHDLQVGLYAEFMPGFLLEFLNASKSYQLENAMLVCQRRALVREQVYVLGRMGRVEDALRLIVSQLHDVPQAIVFVNSQGDDALWDKLIELSIVDAQLTGALLDRIGGYVDPLRLVRAIPNKLHIPELNARLQRIINDFRTSTQLSEGCNAIIIADCMTILNRLMHFRLKPLDSVYLFVDGRKTCHWELYSARNGARVSCDPPNIPRDAESFNPPVHTLGLPLSVQVAVHIADGIGKLVDSHNHASSDIQLRGSHALAALVGQALSNRRLLLSDSATTSSSMRLWSPHVESSDDGGVGMQLQ